MKDTSTKSVRKVLSTKLVNLSSLWFSNVNILSLNKCTTVMQDVNTWGSWVGWYMGTSLLSLQLLCNNQNYFKKVNLINVFVRRVS